MASEQDPKRTLTYRNGWKRSKISMHKESNPEAFDRDHLLGWLSWVARPVAFLSDRMLKYAWYALPVILYFMFQWMVFILARLS